VTDLDALLLHEAATSVFNLFGSQSLVAQNITDENQQTRFNLGMKSYYGDGIQKDLQEAFKYFQKCILSQILSISTKNIYISYLYIFLAVAEAGDPEAQFIVGYMFHHGKGVEENLSRALAWYQKGKLL
jgi:uncharacterized protein